MPFLLKRLTEREDKRRPVKLWSIEVAGRPLAVSGEYEIAPSYFRRRVVGGTVGQPDRFLLEQGLEVEAFYSFGLPLSLFAQLRVGMREDLLSDTFKVRGATEASSPCGLPSELLGLHALTG